MIFIDACLGRETPYTPVWFMRQAGRYLSEYREVRKQVGDFLELCKNPKLAAEVTLQPVDILNTDAAILFSDILVIPNAMGLDLGFFEKEGPKFSTTVTQEQDVERLDKQAYKKLGYVYETISLVRSNLDKDKALIGFCGAPWTLATYMIEGQGSKSYAVSKKILYANPQLLHNLLESLTCNLIEFIKLQIQAGINAFMIFDSWVGALEEESFVEFALPYCQRIAREIKEQYPHIPSIYFPRGSGAYLKCIKGDFNVIGIDYNTPLAYAKEILGKDYILQGNLEPARLYSKESALKGAWDIIQIMKNRRHIFNLGHGMLPDLPRENAIELVKYIHKNTRM